MTAPTRETSGRIFDPGGARDVEVASSPSIYGQLSPPHSTSSPPKEGWKRVRPPAWPPALPPHPGLQRVTHSGQGQQRGTRPSSMPTRAGLVRQAVNTIEEATAASTGAPGTPIGKLTGAPPDGNYASGRGSASPATGWRRMANNIPQRHRRKAERRQPLGSHPGHLDRRALARPARRLGIAVARTTRTPRVRPREGTPAAGLWSWS